MNENLPTERKCCHRVDEDSVCTIDRVLTINVCKHKYCGSFLEKQSLSHVPLNVQRQCGRPQGAATWDFHPVRCFTPSPSPEPF